MAMWDLPMPNATDGRTWRMKTDCLSSTNDKTVNDVAVVRFNSGCTTISMICSNKALETVRRLATVIPGDAMRRPTCCRLRAAVMGSSREVARLQYTFGDGRYNCNAPIDCAVLFPLRGPLLFDKAPVRAGCTSIPMQKLLR